MTNVAIAMNHPIHSELVEATPALKDVAVGAGFLEILLFESSLAFFLFGLASYLMLGCAGGTVLLINLALNGGDRRLNSCVDFGQAEWLNDFLSVLF